MPMDVNELRQFLNEMTDELKSHKINFVQYNAKLQIIFDKLLDFIANDEIPVENRNAMRLNMIAGKNLISNMLSNIIIPDIVT